MQAGSRRVLAHCTDSLCLWDRLEPFTTMATALPRLQLCPCGKLNYILGSLVYIEKPQFKYGPVCDIGTARRYGTPSLQYATGEAMAENVPLVKRACV